MKQAIFIIGAGHSGSTVLAKALNAHSDVFALSEISQFEDQMQNEMSHCGCGELLRKCQFWDDINIQIRKSIGYGIKDDPNKFRLNRPLDKNRMVDKIQFKLSRIAAHFINTKTISNRLENLKILFDTIIKKTSNQTLIDSSKSPKWAFLLGNYLKKHGFEIYIIHLIRDGRAVLHSFLKPNYKVKLKNTETGQYEFKIFPKKMKQGRKNVVKIWKRNYYQCLFYHKILKNSNYYFLRYEDFAKNPEQSLQRLLAFCNLNYEEEMLDLNRFENHMVSGNASRINAERIQTPSRNWMQRLTEDDLNYFENVAGKLNRKIGYM